MGPDDTLRQCLQAAPEGEFAWSGFGPRKAHAHLGRPIVARLDRHHVRSVLDLGCGNGWFTAALARCGFEAMGVDSSRSGIAIAQRENPGMPFVLHDLCQPPVPEWLGRFDAVVAIELIDHLALPRRAIDSALLALKPGGLLIVSVPHHGYAKNLGLAVAGCFDMRWQSLDDHGRMRFYSRHTLTALMREFDLHDLRVETAGRLPPFSRSLIASGHAPR